MALLLRARLGICVLLCACRSAAPGRTDADVDDVCLPTSEDEAITDDVYCGVVDHYGYALDLGTLAADVTLTMRPARDGEACAVVHTRLAPSDVHWNDARVPARVTDADALDVCGARPDDTLAIRAGVTVTPVSGAPYDIGVTRPVDRFGHAFTYLLGWVGECARFGPCDTRASRLARFTFDIAHDPSLVVLCPGSRTEGGGRTRCVLDGTRAPTYSAYGVLASDALVRSTWTSAAGVVVERYEVPEGVIGASVPASMLADFLEHVTSYLGAFPYGDTLRVSAAPTTWLGFEHPASIVLSDTTHTATTAYASPVRHVLLHEIVHQWAGNRTTLADAYDFVWKEAIAEYVAYVFEDERFPASSLVTRAYWDGAARFAAVYPRPLDEPPPLFEVVSYSAYGTGPMMLLGLEDHLGRAVVLEGIRRFLEAPGARSVRDLIDTLEQVSGADLDAYASAYVFGVGEPDWPAFEVATSVENGELTVTVTQHVLAGPPRPAVVVVRVTGSEETRDVTLDFGLAPATWSTTTSVPFTGTVLTTAVDPEHRMLDLPYLPSRARAAPPVYRRLHP